MSSSSLSLLALLSLAVPSFATYSLTESISGSTFFNSFNFFTGADPTSGFVQYVSEARAQSQGYISTSTGQAIIGVDHTTLLSNTSAGRESVRISSKNTYNPTSGGTLILADIQHMPNAECGSWPAFWLVGPNWPTTGEIDIIEGINDSTDDTFVLHTNAGCIVNYTGSGLFDTNQDCSFGGCGGHVNWPPSYGVEYNGVNGGVWALEMADDHISMWYWPRWWVPSDIWNGTPNPSSWWSPFVTYTGCNFVEHFVDLSIVLNTDFCGSWAGDYYWTSSKCYNNDNSCNDFVAKNPSNFTDAYWAVNFIDVYNQ